MTNKEINDILNIFDLSIKNLVTLRLNQSELAKFDKIETDTFGEIIDKLIITHIRYWHLEDKMSDPNLSDSELASLRRKSESLFKSKRPILVNALDKFIVNLVHKKVVEIPENLKLYNGWTN